MERKQDSFQTLQSSLKELAAKVDSQFITDNKTEEEEKQLKLLLFITILITEANQKKKIAEFLIGKYFI